MAKLSPNQFFRDQVSGYHGFLPENPLNGNERYDPSKSLETVEGPRYHREDK